MKKIAGILLLFLCTLSMNAQEAEMADRMRDNGKIYVVIAVMLTILLGIVLYLVRIEKKISNLEKINKK